MAKPNQGPPSSGPAGFLFLMQRVSVPHYECSEFHLTFLCGWLVQNGATLTARCNLDLRKMLKRGLLHLFKSL